MGEYNGVVGGVSSMVTDGFRPWWSGIDGTIDHDSRDETLTIDEAYDAVLNWNVVARDVYVNLGDDESPNLVKDESRIAVVREDTSRILGHHSESYGLVQNESLRDFGKACKTIGDVLCTSAGTLYEDSVPWMLLKLGDDKHFAGLDETLQRFLLVVTSHDGSYALSARPTNVRVECMNTFDWAMRGHGLVSVRHTRNVQDYIPEARRVIREAYDTYDRLDAEIEELMSIVHTRSDFTDKLVPSLLGPEPDEDGRKRTLYEKRRDGLVSAWSRPDQTNIAGTGWGAVMAVNSYENWDARVVGDRADAQARNALRGSYPLTRKARTLVLA